MDRLKRPAPAIMCILNFLLMLQLPFSVSGIDCSTTIANLADGESGVIHSPGFPQSYPQGSGYTCTYQLSIIGEGYITLSFEDFHLHDGPVFTCKNNGTYDYLTINLHNNQSPIYACGVGRPATIIAPKETVTVELVVHAAPSSATFRGFQMRYSFISEEKKVELSSNFHVESTVVPMFEMEEGRFSAPQINPLLPGYTSQSIDSIWYVTAPTDDDRIQLTVTDFYPPYIPAPMLLITDGPTSKSKALQHGVNMANSPFQSSQRFMFVQLKGTVGAGTLFEAEFSFFRDPDVNGDCPEFYSRCRKSDQCIKKHLLCNGRGNCGQGEDEDRCNSPCDPNPCLNGGTCMPSSSSQNSYRCVCSRSFSGHKCAIHDSLTTASFPGCNGACFNGGRCVGGECECPQDYIGTRCEFPVTSGSNPDLEHTSIMIGAFVGAVCLLSICWLVAMARKRYTDGDELQQPGGRPPQRMISVHTPEELGLRRSTTNGPGDLEIPPDYSEVFIEENKPIPAALPSVISANEPMSPPPTYDIVTRDDDVGIVIEFPASENSNLPDVVSQNGSDNSSPAHSNPPSDAPDGDDSLSRQTSRSTDV
ncbi:uncharacterized protein [Apostichopus japonicus]|uniref:uncharacterized protein n=1 Tax=Stichopus japonicus TaxID=307972 RepID=UPI003AB8B438